MKENDLQLTGEKTYLMCFFNNGEMFTSTGTRWSNRKLQAQYKVSGGMHNHQVELEVTY